MNLLRLIVKYIVFYFIFNISELYGQNEASVWTFGSIWQFSFAQNPPADITPTTSPAPGGLNVCTSCVSDGAGNWLLSANNGIVYNNQMLPVANGTLSGVNGRKGILIIKKPGTLSDYYVFYCNSNTGFLNYAVVNTTLSSGSGSVTAKNIQVNNNAIWPTFAAVKHCNGSDVWLLTHESLTSSFYAYKITSSGINPAVISSTGFTLAALANQLTNLKFSPSGKKIATSYGASLVVFDFNPTTGVVSNSVLISNSALGNAPLKKGIEFSRDEAKLYVTAGVDGLFQIDLCASASSSVIASSFTVSNNTNNSTLTKEELQIGIDGKIYVARPAHNSLGVINSPNATGSSCNFADLSTPIFNNSMLGGNLLPNLLSNNFYVPPPLGQFTATINGSVSCRSATFFAPATPSLNCASTVYSITGVSWEFGDPLSGSANTSTLINPVHVFSGSGTYTVKLLYHKLCGKDSILQTLSINGPTLNIMTTPVTCSLAGSASVSASGGGGAFSYTWLPLSQNTSSISAGFSPGTYTVSVFDIVAGCILTETVSVVSNTLITLAVNNSNLLCNAINNATAAAQVSGGTGNYSYLWSPLSQISTSVGGLAAGAYTLTVSDITSSCSASTSFIVSQPPPLLTSIISNTNSACVGNSITLVSSVNGGFPPYSYSWPGISAGNSLVIVSPTINGTFIYSLSVTDANNCTTSNTISLIFNNGPQVVASNATVCLGSSATLSLSGASSCTWQPAGLNGTNIVVSPLSTTVYTVTGYANGCIDTKTTTANVLVVPSPTLNISLSNNTICAQSFNGSSNTTTLTFSGGTNYTLSTPGYFFNPNPNGTISPISLMPPFQPTGVETVTLFGSNGFCTVSKTSSFNIIPNPTISLNQFTSVICSGDSFTYLSAGASSYTWSSLTSGAIIQHTGSVTIVKPSVNSIFSVIGSNQGCFSALIQTTIQVSPLPNVQIMPSSGFICRGGQATLTAIGDGGSYSWYPSYGLNNLNGQSVVASPTAQQNYTVVSSLNGCTNSAVTTLSVFSLPKPGLNLSKTAVCVFDSILVTAFGGNSYFWQTPNRIKYHEPSFYLKIRSINENGTHTLTVFDTMGCSSDTVVNVKVFDSPKVHCSDYMLVGCEPFKSNIVVTQSSGSSSITAMTWNLNGTYFLGNEIKYNFEKQGTYKLVGNIVDGNYCINEVVLTVTVFPKPHANFYTVPSIPTENGEDVKFYNTSTGEKLVKYNWFLNTNHSVSTNRDYAYQFDTYGNYPVTVICENLWGCSDSITKVVRVDPDIAFYVPNSFTPNSDSKNDYFMPVTRGVKKYSLFIYDRWGKIIFSGLNEEAIWDGTFKGQDCKNDTYVWKVIYMTNDGVEKVLTGLVQLLR